MWKAASTWSRRRVRVRVLASLVTAIGVLAPAAAAAHWASIGPAPAEPSSLAVLAVSTSTVSLSWKASNGAMAYEVRTQARKSGSSPTRYRTVAKTTRTRITLDSLPCGTFFTFSVAARRYRRLSGERTIVASTRRCAPTAPAASAPAAPAPAAPAAPGTPPRPAPAAPTPLADSQAPSAPAAASCSKVASPGQGSAQTLLESLSSGQVGCLRGGTYTASGLYVLDFSKSNVTITSYPGERALLVGVIVVRREANGSRLAGVAVEGTGGSAGQTNTIQLLGASDFVIEDSDITNSWRGRSCLIVGNGTADVAVRPVIRRNRFHECGNPTNGNLDHAIYAADVVDATITNNLFWNTAAYALHLYPNAQRTLFAHNVIDGGSPSVAGGVIFAGDTDAASSGNVVEYNVIGYSTRHNIESWWGGAVGGGNVARSNCVFGGGPGDIGATNGFSAQDNLLSNPLFVNRAARNYRLRAESPCLSVVGYDTAARFG